jgi:hypothetical protein
VRKDIYYEKHYRISFCRRIPIKLIREWLDSANNKNEATILPQNKLTCENEILELQITNKSPLGAVVYHTGGIIFQNGWLRFLGSGNYSFQRTITSWNKKCGMDGLLLIADDVVGGFFAINGGYFSEGIGEIYYLSPDTLEWEWLEMGYSDFLFWACTGDMNGFYQQLRWKGWQQVIAQINTDEGISFYPFIWTEEGKDIENCSKSIVSIKELWDMVNEFSLEN